MTGNSWQIREDDLSGAATRELVRLHLAGMHANSPAESVFALDFSGLTAPDVTLWTVWRNQTIAAMGALKTLDPYTGELKSMRTHPDFLRQGAAALMLKHILDVARARGMTVIYLETGRGPSFEPALALYRYRGFKESAAFGNYQPNAFSQFLKLDL
ncbi:MAG: GNAT family N-acetyltransferase [Hyphomicrobiales bacterium]|nr:GNAT family N-acetyltransferase [Hyphomicrobiales bacterium]MDE2113412.1 GNAT family N-acetyltransferase [Hyphomicrobiales bacterium]